MVKAANMSFKLGRKRTGEKEDGWRRAPRFLIAPAILHLSVSLLLNLVGRLRLFPYLFDPDGISPALAFDSFYYRRKSMQLVAALAGGNIQDWLSAPVHLHVKLYSLSFAILSPLFGFSMLSVEPLNLFYYLSIVALVFKLCQEIFERRAVAWIAAIVVALWPSLLLHTTQLLRDPLFIVVMLVIVLVLTRWLTGSRRSLRAGLFDAAVCGVASAVVWVTRYNMWPMVILFTLMGIVLLIVRQRRERGWLAGNLLGAALLLLMLACVPTVIGTFLQPDSRLNDPEVVELSPESPCPDEPPSSAVPTAPPSSTWARLMERADAAVARLGDLRRKFSMFYASAGSNLDACVRLRNVSDLLAYLPRALSHGFLAPYPSMWIRSGNSVGLSGRLLSGVEMIALYLIELLAMFGLWRNGRRLSVWFIVLISVTGIVALSLVTVNVAVLFRLRYFFSILLIMLGAEGAVQAFSLWGREEKSERMSVQVGRKA